MSVDRTRTLYLNLGGTANVISPFVPFIGRRGLFYFFSYRIGKGQLKKEELDKYVRYQKIKKRFCNSRS
ncbi:hypothetical protein CM318V1_90011 [Carnobacterium maltaromaticum]|nr:conserved hypothetical protein [Carnobacterium maltaromaticum]CRH20409.1 hypothetical protein CM318V1_90011 [Carnobacterium maltaromaticum]